MQSVANVGAKTAAMLSVPTSHSPNTRKPWAIVSYSDGSGPPRQTQSESMASSVFVVCGSITCAVMTCSLCLALVAHYLDADLFASSHLGFPAATQREARACRNRCRNCLTKPREVEKAHDQGRGDREK